MSGADKNDANNQVVFINLIKKEREAIDNAFAKCPPLQRSAISDGLSGAGLVESKSLNAAHGLETSTFTICARVRPMLRGEVEAFEESKSEGSMGMYECMSRAQNEPTTAASSMQSKTLSGGGAGKPCGSSVKAAIPDEINATSAISSGETMVVFKPKLAITGRPKLEKEHFLFDKVFDRDSSNKDVYDVCRPVVKRSIIGQMGTIFAFGQTGSGKTHTMNAVLDAVVDEIFLGTKSSPTPTLHDSSMDSFTPSSSAGASTYQTEEQGQDESVVRVSFSYLELLGSNAKDCLGAMKSMTTPSDREGEISGPPSKSSSSSNSTGGSKSMAMSVEIGELLDGTVAIRNLSEHVARSASDLKSLIDIAKSFRATAATERNAESSRSHGIGIFRIFHSTSSNDVDGGPAPGVLYVIDLAGSERMADSKLHDAERLEETKAINLSLMCLKECIRARTVASSVFSSSAEKTHVPYRRSKLTLLMKGCFDVASNRLSNTVVLAHVSPLARDSSHSLNTLKYAAPLRVAVAKTSKKMERDIADPAMWSHDEAVNWVGETLRSASSASSASGSGISSSALSDGVAVGAEDMRTIEEISSGGAVNRGSGQTGDGSTRFVQELSKDQVDIVVRALMSHPSSNGLTLCRLTELEYLKKITMAFDSGRGRGGGDASPSSLDSSNQNRHVTGTPGSISKLLYDKLWVLICDAKTRRRRPNGAIISKEEEALEVRKALEAQVAASELWKAREEALKSDF